MSKHHSKLENVLIHSLTILFTFSALTSAFLGYGVYQNKNVAQNDYLVAPPVQAVNVSSWSQTSWNGGTSSSTFTIPWDSSGGWNKYSSQSNAFINSSGVKGDVTGSGVITSSVLDLGSKRFGKATAFETSPNGNASVETRGGSSPGNLSSWDQNNCTSDDRYIQYRIVNLPQDGTGGQGYVTKVTIKSAQASLSGAVRDASTGEAIVGATVSYKGESAKTYGISPKPSFISAVLAGGGGGRGIFYLNIEYDANISSYPIKASASGYESQTKSYPITLNGCWYQNYNIVFDLKKSSSSSSSTSTSGSTSSSRSTSTTSGTGTVADTSPTITLSDFQKTKLPKVFLAKGNKTTVLSKIKDHKKIKNFTLDIPGKNKIVFKETLNLSTQKTIDLLEKLDKYVKIGTIGKIELDSKAFAALNKKATLTMEKLKHLSTPEVLVDEKKDTKSVVSNTVFDKDKETLTFDVAHFTVFEAVPKLELLSPLEATSEQNTSIVGQISDPSAIVIGRFNEVDLAPIKVDKETGKFAITNLSFKEGENFLTLEATSKLGKVLPVVATIVYNPSGVVAAIEPGGPNNRLAIMTIILIGALAFLIILGYLVYRRRKHGHPGTPSKESPQTQKPKSTLPPVNNPGVSTPEVFHV